MFVDATNHRGKRELDLDNVLYARASNDDVFANTVDDQFKLSIKLYDIEEFEKFIRINKSEVVNITKIKDAVPLFNSKIRLKLIDSTILYVNRTYIKRFKTYLTGGVKK